MKNILLVVLIIITVIAIVKLFQDYTIRMVKYNKYVCAVEGFKPDCTTPLGDEEKLK